MFSKKYESILFGFILSGFMSLLVSGISTFRAVGWIGGFLGVWVSAWLAAWLIAFPVVLFVAPFTRRIVGYLVEKPDTK